MVEQAIVKQIAAQQDSLVELLGELVSHHSGTYDKTDVDTVGQLLRSQLETLEFDIETVPQERYGIM